MPCNRAIFALMLSILTSFTVVYAAPGSSTGYFGAQANEARQKELRLDFYKKSVERLRDDSDYLRALAVAAIEKDLNKNPVAGDAAANASPAAKTDIEAAVKLTQNLPEKTEFASTAELEVALSQLVVTATVDYTTANNEVCHGELVLTQLDPSIAQQNGFYIPVTINESDDQGVIGDSPDLAVLEMQPIPKVYKISCQAAGAKEPRLFEFKFTEFPQIFCIGESKK